MASHVTVIATDLRRATVKVSPGTYMIDVLQEACKKLSLTSDKYLLKSKQKQVDLSIVWRQTGLSPGAKLELVQKSNTPSAVSVALQLPAPESSAVPGGRLIEKLPSDFTVWKVLRQFESGTSSQGKNFNLTARGVAQTSGGSQSGSGQLYYETPVLNIMGRELSTFADYQKTLSQLGYNSGSVLIRLSFKKTDQTLFAAMEEISQFFADAHADVAKAVPETTESGANQVLATDDGATSEPPAVQQTQEEPEDHIMVDRDEGQAAKDDQASTTLAESPNDVVDAQSTAVSDTLQPVGIFQAPTGTTPAAALMPLQETDYTPTIAHAQLHQARLLQSSQNKRLPSDKEIAERAQAQEAKLSSVTSVSIKVRFPDNTSAQWSFGADATGATLYNGVKSVMADDSLSFKLVVPGSHITIKDADGPKNLLIHDYKLTRNVLVNLHWDDSVPAPSRRQPFLKSDVAQRATAIKVPDLPQETEDQDDRKKAIDSAKPKPSDEGQSMGKKLPKWLKLPGKK